MAVSFGTSHTRIAYILEHTHTVVPVALVKRKFTNLVQSVPDDFNVEFVQVCLTDTVLEIRT